MCDFGGAPIKFVDLSGSIINAKFMGNYNVLDPPVMKEVGTYRTTNCSGSGYFYFDGNKSYYFIDDKERQHYLYNKHGWEEMLVLERSEEGKYNFGYYGNTKFIHHSGS